MPPKRPSKIVTLRLAPESLRKVFPPEKIEEEESKPASSPSSATPDEPVVADTTAPSLQPSDSADTPAPDGTPVNGDSSSVPPTNPAKRRGIPGPKPGAKRTAAQQSLDANGVPKPRGKPGPKKKPRPGDLVDGIPFSGPAPTTAAKMNPKANQGAINANLRALDRSGKPCRKWERKGFHLHSFTGVAWGVASWKAPPKTRAEELNGEVKSDTEEESNIAADGVKMQVGSSAAAMSEGSGERNGEDTTMMMGDVTMGSSPAPMVGAAA